MTQQIQQDFDRLANYPQGGWNHNNHYHRFLRRQWPGQRQTALDIGCGTGEFSRLLAQSFAQVVAIDLSPNMIAVARQQSSAVSNLEFHIADVMQWPLPVNRFDLIASIATLHHLPLEPLLPRLKAALNPGGKLIILDLLAPGTILAQGSDLIAIPLNWGLEWRYNRRHKRSPEAISAWQAHLQTDQYLSLAEARRLYNRELPGVQVRKHLFWRYSVVWEKPKALSVSDHQTE